MLPPQPIETGKVAVGRDPLASRLDRERGELGVRDEVALGTGVSAEPREDGPVTVTRFQRDRVV